MAERDDAERGKQDGAGGNGRGGTPRPSDEQDAPEPERPRRPAEEAGMAPHQREDPPQAEGDRDAAEGE